MPGQQGSLVLNQWQQMVGKTTMFLLVTYVLRTSQNELKQYIWQLELEDRGHTGGLRSWNSALGRRLRVQAPGHGSFSPVATFKLCSYKSLYELKQRE